MYDDFFLTRGSAKVGVQPQGGYVTSWVVDETPVLYIGSKIRRTGIPILFPHFGKSHRYRMHGFGRDSLWQVREKTEHTVKMILDDTLIDETAHAEYPWAFSASITVGLPGENELLYTLEVQNTGNTTLPISPGLHPYWTIAHDRKDQLRIEGISGFEASSFDWTQSPPDHRFPFTGHAKVYFPDKVLTIEDVSVEKPKISHLVVWSQTPVRDPDYDFVCIEPICGDDYRIDEAPLLIQPGTTWQMSIRFSVTLS